MKTLEKFFLNANTWQEWIVALGIAAVTIAVLLILEKVAVKRLHTRGKKTRTPALRLVAEILGATKIVLLIPVALYLGSQALALPPKFERLIANVTIVALLIQAAVWGNRLIELWIKRKFQKKKEEEDAASATTLAVLGFIGRLVLWSLVALLALDNLGFNITTLVAGLGIGGIAVALAAQNILGDLFASLSIVLDKPFLIGDFIIVDDKMGTVEYIGLKTTRIRSLGGEQIIFSNTDLLNSRIRNYKRMIERRIDFSLGVTYQTPAEKLAQIPAIIRETVEQQEKTRFDRAHFKEYGDFALLFEVVYYVLDPDYNRYMDIQQAINLAIFHRFQKEGIEFAYPTQSLYLHQTT
jgi:small-conductance mechanosensitive channel